MKKNLIVLQEGNKDCGAAALLSIIRYYGGDMSLERIIEMTKTGKEGTNFYNISLAANEIGLSTRSFKVEDVTELRKINNPYIVQLNYKYYFHFVVVYKLENDKVLLMDPAKGKVIMDIFDFSNLWTGYIMFFDREKILVDSGNSNKLRKIIISILLDSKGLILFLIVLSIIIVLFSSFATLYSQIIFDNVIDTNKNNLIIITIIFSILFVIKNMTLFFRNYLLVFLNQKLDINIILKSFEKIILLPFSYYKRRTTSEVLSRLNDLTRIKNVISKLLLIIFLDNITFIFSLIIIYNINSKILMIVFIILIFYLFILLCSNGIVKRVNIKSQEDNEKINTKIIESVSSYETVKGLNIESNVIYGFNKLYNKAINNNYYGNKVNISINFFKELVTDIGLLVISYYSFCQIFNNDMTIGNYITINLLINYLFFPLQGMIDILNEFHYVKNSIIRANDLLDINEEVFDRNKLMINGDIKINNLSFTYNNKYYPIKNLNLEINSGSRILIIGSSGGGKSTLLKLIYKYYSVERNKIFINNDDINDYSLKDIRENITYISQNELLYNDSIRNNIILDRNISEEEFLKVVKITYVDEIINNNMLGYDFVLEENGANISGGQRQRIIIARSLLKKSKIIMIDEGLSQIDSSLERIILENLFYLYQDKTFIIVSHRKNNFDLYDKILELNDGKLEVINE